MRFRVEEIKRDRRLSISLPDSEADMQKLHVQTHVNSEADVMAERSVWFASSKEAGARKSTKTHGCKDGVTRGLAIA